MDRRTFLTGTIVAAATTLSACKSRNEPTLGEGKAVGAKALRVSIHGGFAHIFQRRGGNTESLLFGPARAVHGHPHGIRLRVIKSDIEPPTGDVPFGEMTIDNTPYFVWDLLGWEVKLLPDGNTPGGNMQLPNNPAVTDPQPAAEWNSLYHLPDLAARGAGALHRNYRSRMTSSVLLNAGAITVEPPSDRCAQYAMLNFGNVPYAVTDKLRYEIGFGDTVVLEVQGPGLSSARQTLRPTGNALNLIVDFEPIPTARYHTHGAVQGRRSVEALRRLERARQQQCHGRSDVLSEERMS
jgi:hypothetical protein